MAAVLFALPTLSDAATLTASNQASTSLADDNLQTLNPRKYWRSTTTTPNVVVDLGSAKAIRLVSVLYTNAVTTDKWRVRGATSEANLTASPGYDSQVGGVDISAWPGGADLSSWDRTHTRLYLSTAETFRWWRIDFDWSSNGDGYVEASRLYIAAGEQFSTGIDAQGRWTPTLLEPAVRTVNQSGGVTPRGFAKRRRVDLSLAHLTEAEALGQLSVLRRTAGSSGDVLVLIDPEEDTYPMDYMYYGLMTAEQPIANAYTVASGAPRYSAMISIEEP